MRKKLYHVWTMLIILVTTTASCQSPLFGARGTPVPTPQCVEPTLTLGSLKYRVESITREADGFPDIPKSRKDVAYWVEGTTINYSFGLSPTKENLALDSIIKAGDPITINWADCSTDEYVIKSIELSGSPDASIFDQSNGGITVFVQTDSSGLLIRGERPIPQSSETSVAPANTVQIDVSLQDLTSSDPQTIKIGFIITNKGTQPIILTNNDISLKTENGPEVFPSMEEPALPQVLKPGDALTLAATFPKPPVNSAVLRILDTTFDYYFQ